MSGPGRLLPELAGFRIYAPDLRGQGDADKPQNGYSLAEQAADAAAVLDALEVPTTSILGSSSGGYIAQQLAVEHPDRVTALVLVGAALTLQGRPPFAAEVESLTDPVAEDWVRNFLTGFPLIQDVPSWFLEDQVFEGQDACPRVEAEPARSEHGCTANRIGNHSSPHTDPLGRAGQHLVPHGSGHPGRPY